MESDEYKLSDGNVKLLATVMYGLTADNQKDGAGGFKRVMTEYIVSEFDDESFSGAKSALLKLLDKSDNKSFTGVKSEVQKSIDEMGGSLDNDSIVSEEEDGIIELYRSHVATDLGQ